MGYEFSDGWNRKHRRIQRRQDQRWAAKAGPVVVKWVCAGCGDVVEGEAPDGRLCSECSSSV